MKPGGFRPKRGAWDVRGAEERLGDGVGISNMLVTHRIRGLYGLHTLAQLGLACLSYWAWLAVLSNFYSEVALPERYLIYSLLILIGLLLEAAFRYKTDPIILPLAFAEKHRIAFRQTLAAGLPVLFFLVATKDAAISRVFLFSYVLVLYLALVLSLQFFPPIIAQHALRGARKEKALLVGTAAKVAQFKPWLDRKGVLGIETAGVLLPAPETAPAGLPVLGDLSNFQEIIERHKITVVVLAEMPSSADFMRIMINLCERQGLRLLVVSNLAERFQHPIILREDDGVHLLGLREEVLENPLNRFLKRSLDLAVALPASVLLLPLACLVVRCLQWRQSPGPLFYRQERAGLQNNLFLIWKFRTMHLDNPDPARQAVRQDERVFPAGRWLRKYSLDELPQFLNVLSGEMSVVGPRPHLPRHNEQFSRVMSGYHIRALIKPGITGLAQVRGFRGEAGSDEDLRQRIQSDLYYLENWSLALDLLIILRTAWQLLRPPKTAY